MKISNFKLLEIIDDDKQNIKYVATVDEVIERFMRKSIYKTREIYKETNGYSWCFTDNGEDVPYQINCICKGFEAKNRCKMHEVKL